MNTRFPMLPIILIFPFFLITGCISKDYVFYPITDEIGNMSENSKVQTWEDGMRTNPAGNEFEWWYFDASFTDGSTAVIVFSTKNILRPAGKADPEVSIVITRSSGDKITVFDNPGIKYFEASDEFLDVKISSSYVKGDLSRCFVHFSRDNIEADLTFTSKTPSWRPGSGKIYFDQKKEKYFAWLPAIPFGNVEGTLKYDGKEIKVTGTGYHDHNWGNVRLDKVMAQWYWGRARINDYTLIFSQMLTSPKYGSIKVPVFYIAKGNDILSSSNFGFSFTPSSWSKHSGGRDYPEKIMLNVKQKEMEISIIITDPVFIEAKDLLEDLPWIVRGIIKIYTLPYYFRFSAKFKLEFRRNNRIIEKNGTGIFEMMLLKGKQTIRE